MRLAALVLLAGLLPSCGPERPARPNIILFTIDTLRADRVNAKTSPFATRLAKEGVTFDRCYAPRGQTHPSLASLLTGKYPATHGLRSNGMALPPEHVPLPVLLQQSGYRTAGFCSNLDITHWSFWVRGFDVAEDGVRGGLNEEGYDEAFRYQKIWDDRTVAAATRWIDALPEEPDAPIFLWVHLYDVHAPYAPLEEQARLFRDPGYAGPARYPTGGPGEPEQDRINPLLDRWTLGAETCDEADLKQVRALYDASILECDGKLARVAEALAAKGLWNGSLVVFTSDHGDELGDHHRYFFHGNSIYDSTLRIPLILARPGREIGGRTSHALAQILDLFPTLLEAASVEIPQENEGFSLLPILDEDAPATPRTHVFAEWEDLIFSVSDGRFKYIHNPGGVRPKKRPYHLRQDAAFPLECFELYDLESDPLEQANLFNPQHPRMLELREELARFLSNPLHSKSMSGEIPDGDPLEALGYVGGSRSREFLRVKCPDR
ncbi:MAG: sulfatase-like hydrolase/transferase [Planctomycetota bacterium]